MAGLNIRDLSERLCLTGASRESVNVNSKELKCLEELVTAIAAVHNVIRAGGEEVIPT
jgi:hypothetical protein